MNWTHIMLHHSLTKDTQTVSWNAIRRYHVDVLGWKDIGYHFGVELVGKLYQVLPGRSLTRPGAHCYQRGMNRKAIGICVVGNFDQDPPVAAQLKMLHGLCLSLMGIYQISADHICMHREFAPYKTCPGKLFPFQEFVSSCNLGIESK